MSTGFTAFNHCINIHSLFKKTGNHPRHACYNWPIIRLLFCLPYASYSIRFFHTLNITDTPAQHLAHILNDKESCDMIRHLLEKKFNKKMDWMLYLVPFINLFICYNIFSLNRTGSPFSRMLTFILTLIFSFIAIGVNLLRFIVTLNKPYEKNNLKIVISCIFSTITFFSIIYSLIHMYLPNSFSGLEGATQLDSCVNAFYFSVITFTTVGYGDIHPLASLAKIIVSIETMSFFIFFVILTSNHSTFFKSKDIETDST